MASLLFKYDCPTALTHTREFVRCTVSKSTIWYLGHTGKSTLIMLTTRLHYERVLDGFDYSEYGQVT